MKLLIKYLILKLMICLICKTDVTPTKGMFDVSVCPSCGEPIKTIKSSLEDNFFALEATRIIPKKNIRTAREVITTDPETVLKASGFARGVTVKVRKEFYRIHEDIKGKELTIDTVLIKNLDEKVKKYCIILYFKETGKHHPYVGYHFIKI